MTAYAVAMVQRSEASRKKRTRYCEFSEDEWKKASEEALRLLRNDIVSSNAVLEPYRWTDRYDQIIKTLNDGIVRIRNDIGTIARIRLNTQAEAKPIVEINPVELDFVLNSVLGSMVEKYRGKFVPNYYDCALAAVAIAIFVLAHELYHMVFKAEDWVSKFKKTVIERLRQELGEEANINDQCIERFSKVMINYLQDPYANSAAFLKLFEIINKEIGLHGPYGVLVGTIHEVMADNGYLTMDKLDDFLDVALKGILSDYERKELKAIMSNPFVSNMEQIVSITANAVARNKRFQRCVDKKNLNDCWSCIEALLQLG
ncbi:hypothetical protein IPA_02015 [Ignicoccus pacificus DSM 13166]|uniref:Uncharacterized protein n=1 Tax=Ignicoccus pacificus DSM 13166 TaxID=940294 RepID=A0A977KAP9_9CREN|nr:hypothetical protein IPA_02015 [Ignicoccus pacificus DSM 13166]